MARTTLSRTVLTGGAALAAAAAILVASSATASADTVIDGRIGLGAAESFSVLGASAVTNTGPSFLVGDLGISPNTATSVTGFDGGQGETVVGARHYDDDVAANAQADAATAYGVAASLTPSEPPVDVTQLDGLTLRPGVYTGGAVDLAVGGSLVFEGTASSVWVIQVASSLTINANSTMVFPEGASVCNVFWQVSESATIGGGADVVGTIVAEASISLVTGADVQGRLIALTGAVTLDTNDITAPVGCAPAGEVSETTEPSITSPAPPDGTVGTPYSHTITADGTPAPVYSVVGDLPPGLVLDETTGVISGTPTTPGDTTFTIVADNPDNDDDSETYTVTIVAAPPVASPPVTPPGESAPPTGAAPSAPAPSAPAPSAPGGGGGPDDSSTGGSLPVTGGDALGGLAVAAIALIVGALGLMAGMPRLRLAAGRRTR